MSSLHTADILTDAIFETEKQFYMISLKKNHFSLECTDFKNVIWQIPVFNSASSRPQRSS